jgi:uncharacterized protein (TIGR03437 family)
MNSGKIKSLSRAAVLVWCCLAAASGQTQDNSQNALLNGSFRFRHVAVQLVDANFDPTDITASYGTIMFDGAGNYTIAGTSIDPSVQSGAPVPLNVTATYAIGSNGSGYLTNPLYPNDPNALIYGAVSQGIFAGSSTESQNDGNTLDDIFVAIPVGSGATASTFTGNYQTGLLDFTNSGSAAVKNALFELSPSSGTFGPVTLNGQAANQTDRNGNTLSLLQSITGATYSFPGDGSVTLTIPLATSVTSTNALFASGSKTLFQSADGNFILGWTAAGYDIFFGVKALAIPATDSITGGLYFTTALEDIPGSGVGTDSYYGSTKLFGDSVGDGIVHQRVNSPQGPSFDYGTDDLVPLNSDGTAGPDFNLYDYIFGDGGKAYVAIGTSGFFSLHVGLQAPTFSGSGVFLNPTGIVNAASDQPVTASLAPGELITLYGSGLSSVTMSAPGPGFPTTLGGVTVSIDSTPCPIYYVSPGQMAVIVPYEVALNQTGLANIQVSNNGTLSNIVQMYLSDSAPGSFSQNLEGIGLAAAEHAATGLPVTGANPAQSGEYISLYMTGLGTVSPTITDGAPGPSTTLSYSDIFNTGNLSVYFTDYTIGGSSVMGTIQYAGLAPYLTGVYQMNVQVPTGGLGTGDDVYVEFVTDAAVVNQIQIPYGTSRLKATGAARPAFAGKASAIKSRRLQGTTPAAHRVIRGGLQATKSNN